MHLALICLFFIYWEIHKVAPEFHERHVQGEDRAVEWLTFIGFLGAAAVSWTALRFRAAMGRKTLAYFALLGLFFFVCAGEEISWGQRIFGFGTPDAMSEVNEQDEFNLHNLKFQNFHPKDIVSWFMKIYGIILPLVFIRRYLRGEDEIFKYIPSPAITPLFVIPEMMSVFENQLVVLVSNHFGPFPRLPPHCSTVAVLIKFQFDEIVEMYWGLGILIAMLTVFFAWKRKIRPASAQ